MKYEEFVEEFNKIVVLYSWELNDETTRREIIRKFTEMIYRLRDEGKFRYTLIKKFVDVSTSEIIDRGGFEIKVELIDGVLVSISEYCEMMTDKEKHAKLLMNSLDHIFNNYNK